MSNNYHNCDNVREKEAALRVRREGSASPQAHQGTTSSSRVPQTFTLGSDDDEKLSNLIGKVRTFATVCPPCWLTDVNGEVESGELVSVHFGEYVAGPEHMKRLGGVLQGSARQGT